MSKNLIAPKGSAKLSLDMKIKIVHLAAEQKSINLNTFSNWYIVFTMTFVLTYETQRFKKKLINKVTFI